MQRFCIIFKFSIMPRKPRESSGTGIYHVMLRGINRQDIFDDTEDYWTFIKMMSAVPIHQNPVKAGLVKTAKDYSRIPTPH